jgi:hypothetical protein
MYLNTTGPNHRERRAAKAIVRRSKAIKRKRNIENHKFLEAQFRAMKVQRKIDRAKARKASRLAMSKQ